MSRESWLRNLEDILGAEYVCFQANGRHERVWNALVPKAIALPADREQVCELMRLASTERLKVAPIGRGTKLHMGGAAQPVDLVLSLDRMNRICDYPASDLTISVEAGLPIRELARTLAAKGQMLPLDVPFADEATVGGATAANSSGPRRLAYGTWRDFVLGLQFITADGKLAKGGGKVVKNVAGYDVPKLLIGSHGTLGVIVEATFKVFPQPPASATVALGFRSAQQAAQATRQILHSPLIPQALDLVDAAAASLTSRTELLPAPFTLLAGAAGQEAVLERFERELPALVRASGLTSFSLYRGEQEASLWCAVQEMTPAFLRAQPEGVVVKSSLPLSRIGDFIERSRATADQHGVALATLARAGSGIVYTYLWPASPDRTAKRAEPLGRAPEAQAAEETIRAAEQRGGRAIVEWCPAELKSKMNLWGTLGDDFAWMRKLKAALDPQGILNPGRFYGGI